MNKNNQLTPEELDAYLTARQQGELPVSSLPASREIKLADQLLSLAENAQPNPGFVAALEVRLAEVASSPKQKLLHQSRRKTPMFKRLTFSLVGAAMLALVAVFVIPLLHPKNLPLLPPLSAMSAYAHGADEVSASGFFSGTQFILEAELPSGPGRAAVYEQNQPAANTPEQALRLAKRFGVSGPVYIEPIDTGLVGNDSSPVMYTILDGSRQVMVMGPQTAYYVDGNLTSTMFPGNTLPFEQAIPIAERFLKERGLLDFPYQVEPDPSGRGLVRFVQLLDGHPIQDSGISVTVASDGRVVGVGYLLLDFSKTADYPLISAQEAWEGIFSGKYPSGRVDLSWAEPPSAVLNIHCWQPAYQAGETVELFDIIRVFRPAEGQTAQPLLVMGSLHLNVSEGDIQALSAITDRMVKVSGQVRQDESGALVLDVTGWSDTPAEAPIILIGAIQRQGDQALFLGDGGQTFLLPHAPADLTDGLAVSISGRETGRAQDGYPVLEWDYLQSPPTDASGEGITIQGGKSVAVVVIQEAVTATQVISNTPSHGYPAEPGQTIDGLEGQLFVIAYENTDGNRSLEATLSDNPLAGDGWIAQLTGAITGIEQYDELWVRVWGRFNVVDGQPTIQVERYEKAYPDLHIQAWLGSIEIVEIEGQKAELLTTQSGEKFVLASTIGSSWLDQQPEIPFRQSIVEGVQRDETFGGYIVIHDSFRYAGVDIERMTNLDGYQLTERPRVAHAPGTSLLSGSATIERVELGYYTVLTTYAPENAGLLYVQPVWLFSGHMDDGRSFTIIVQAVKEKYVK